MARFLAIVMFGWAAVAQTPADLYTYEEFLAWMARQPAAVQKSADVLDTYKQYLLNKGLDSVDAETQIRVIRTQGSQAEVEHWNKLLTADKPTFRTEPNAFLMEMVKGRKPGKALDVGMGQGRNTIWLAQQGWAVTGFDPADRAVTQAKATAAKLGVAVTATVAGIESFSFGEGQWDLIVVSWVSFREQAAKISRALRPGGILVVEGAHRDAAKGNPMGVVFDTAEIPGLFRELRVVRYQEPVETSDFGLRRERLVQYCGERMAEAVRK